jgi:SSS family solute:Na+ symporter
MVRSGRACSIVLALAAMLMAPMIDTTGSLYNYLQRINATFFGPMLAIILLGFLTKRVSPLAAKVSLIAGPLVFYLLVFAFEARVQAALKTTFGLVDDLHFLHFLAIVFVLTLVVAFVISYFRPAEKIYEQSYTRDVDITPWRYAKPAGLAIVAATVLFYVALSQ